MSTRGALRKDLILKRLDQSSHTLLYQNPYKWIKISWGPFHGSFTPNHQIKRQQKIILG